LACPNSATGSGATVNATWKYASGSPDSNPTSWTAEAAILAAGFPLHYTETGDYPQSGKTDSPWAVDTILTHCLQAGISVDFWGCNTWGWAPPWGSGPVLIQDATLTGTPGYGAQVWEAIAAIPFTTAGKTTMKTTLTWTLPTTRSDTTPFTAAMYGSTDIYKNGAITPYANVAAPLLTWADTAAAANGDKYDITILDNEGTPVQGLVSNTYTVANVTLAPPGAAVLTGVTA